MLALVLLLLLSPTGAFASSPDLDACVDPIELDLDQVGAGTGAFDVERYMEGCRKQSGKSVDGETAAFRIAFILYESGRDPDFLELQALADGGHPRAAYVAHAIFGNNGDEERSERYLARAFELGEPNAKATMGWRYVQGTGVDQDVSRGVELLQESSDQGNPSGSMFLGLYHNRGKGVPELAVEYFLKAAEQGAPEGYLWAGDVYYYRHPNVFEGAEKAWPYYRMAAKLEVFQALARLLLLESRYEVGSGETAFQIFCSYDEEIRQDILEALSGDVDVFDGPC